MTFRILLDAGHGKGEAFNRGSVIGNEGDNNFYYSMKLKEALERYTGVNVDLTRPNIKDNPSLKKRGNSAEGYDLLLSLHSNAAGASVRGVEIWEDVDTDDGGLALKLCESLTPFFGKNRGVRWKELGGTTYTNEEDLPHDLTDWYGILRNSKAKSSMLIEHGFHTNLADCKAYVEQREEIAEATAATVAKHYALAKKGEYLNVQRPPSTPTAQKPIVIIDEYEERGQFFPKYDMRVRDRPSTSSKTVAFYDAGSTIPSKGQQYDRVTWAEGYVWISYIARSGKRRYVAVRPIGQPRGIWGPCL